MRFISVKVREGPLFEPQIRKCYRGLLAVLLLNSQVIIILVGRQISDLATPDSTVHTGDVYQESYETSVNKKGSWEGNSLNISTLNSRQGIKHSAVEASKIIR